MRDTRRFPRLLAAIATLVTFVGFGVASRAAPAAADGPPNGYALLTGHGGIYTHGTNLLGAPGTDPLQCPNAPYGPARTPVPDGSCWTMAYTPSGFGYWLVNSITGQISRYGSAGDYGSPLLKYAYVSPEFMPIMRQIVSTPTGKGYWVYEVGSSLLGTVDRYGDAGFFGDTSTLARQHPGGGFHGIPVGLAPTATGKGYWEVYSDGGVFAFGDARFLGSLGGIKLNAPVVGIESTASGKGYWLVADDGGVFAFGDARFGGSAAGTRHHPIIGMARNPGGPGYWLASDNGEIFTFGGAPFYGTPVSEPGPHPHVFAIAVRHGG